MNNKFNHKNKNIKIQNKQMNKDQKMLDYNIQLKYKHKLNNV